MGQVIVFAYGSNLDDQQMRARCANARVEARAVLPNHARAFGGFSQRCVLGRRDDPDGLDLTSVESRVAGHG